VRRRRVGPRISERSEAGFLLGDRRQDVEKVARRSRQAVEARDQKHVAGSWSSTRRSWARSVFAPLAVSRQTFSAPAARNCFT
jgi:hypothetical protein